jgi:hypothetical protein
MVEKILLPRARTRRDLWANYSPFSLASSWFPGLECRHFFISAGHYYYCASFSMSLLCQFCFHLLDRS